jgi:hypothetical protein
MVAHASSEIHRTTTIQPRTYNEVRSQTLATVRK